MNKIAAAVEPLRADAMDRAEAYARNMIDRAYEELAANGWDLDKVAPRPHGYMNRRNYMMAKGRRSFFSSITKSVDEGLTLTIHYINRNEYKVEANEERAQRFIDQARKDANGDFDSFIVKLTKKVGDCDSAEIDARSVWQYSHLTVRKGDVVEVWKTQQIVNVSPLGKPFNQWPTRKIK
jgi:hypothetical protein